MISLTHETRKILDDLYEHVNIEEFDEMIEWLLQMACQHVFEVQEWGKRKWTIRQIVMRDELSKRFDEFVDNDELRGYSILNELVELYLSKGKDYGKKD